ncbi:PQ loop repeat-domain-containing protein [Trametes elegans]|nr:PQ loop repeat-domain-containing protein [Trametes elegans]
MPANSAAENALGTIGTVCWTIQLVPQIWKSWRTKSTEGLSEWLVLLWGASGPFLGVYAIVENLNIPLIVQPQLFGVLAYVSWAQCQYYGRKRSKWAVLAMCVALMAVSAGFEAGMVYAVKPAYNSGNIRPVQFFGIFSSVLIALALLPQYWEIYKYKEVVGLSIVFITVDMAGGVFSDLSLAFKEEFDIIAGVTYSIVVVMDGVVLICALILNPMAERRRKRMAEGNGLDDLVVPGNEASQGADTPQRQEGPRVTGTATEGQEVGRVFVSDGHAARDDVEQGLA